MIDNSNHKSTQLYVVFATGGLNLQTFGSGYDVTLCEQIFAKSGSPRELILYFQFVCGKTISMYNHQDGHN